jgi:hypothetical protein
MQRTQQTRHNGHKRTTFDANCDAIRSVALPARSGLLLGCLACCISNSPISIFNVRRLCVYLDCRGVSFFSIQRRRAALKAKGSSSSSLSSTRRRAAHGARRSDRWWTRRRAMTLSKSAAIKGRRAPLRCCRSLMRPIALCITISGSDNFDSLAFLRRRFVPRLPSACTKVRIQPSQTAPLSTLQQFETLEYYTPRRASARRPDSRRCPLKNLVLRKFARFSTNATSQNTS